VRTKVSSQLTPKKPGLSEQDMSNREKGRRHLSEVSRKKDADFFNYNYEK